MGYTVVAKVPWVTSVYPFSGPTHGGALVTLRGWNFEPHCARQLYCKFGDVKVPAKFYTTSTVTCLAPCRKSPGYVSVEVSNDNGGHWSFSGVQFGYVGEAVDENSPECAMYIPKEERPQHAPH